MSVREIQVDDARSSAFPSGRQCHAGFAQAPASDEKGALLRTPEQFILELPGILRRQRTRQVGGRRQGFQ